MDKKGLTYIELLVILSLIPVVIALVAYVFKPQDYFKRARDLQRVQDINSLNNALNFYFSNAKNIDPDGPYLDKKGIDEEQPTIFVSIPVEKDKFFETCFYYPNGKTYFIYQTNKNDYRRIDSYGWIPINFLEVNYQQLSSLPVDPINDFQSGLYYLYAFQRNPLKYEISVSFESSDFLDGGKNDHVSNDGGNDDNRFEMGADLNIIPGFLFKF